MRILRDILLKNWGLKLTSVFLAFFLWLAVRGEPPAERVATVPLEIVLPADMEITGERPNSVDVTLRGSAVSLGQGQPVPSCRIDLLDAGEGIHVVSLTTANVRLPRTAGLEVVSIRPARVRLVLEKTLSRVVPIRVSWGEPSLKFEVYSVSVTPSTATIMGPRSSVERLREVRTENVSLASQQESFRTLVRLSVDDSVIHVTPAGLVEVAIQLGARRQIRTVARIPVTPDDPDASVSPSRVSVSLLVPATVERQFTAGDFEARVSTRNADSARKVFQARPEVKLKSPVEAGVSIAEVKPAEVTVRRGGNN